MSSKLIIKTLTWKEVRKEVQEVDYVVPDRKPLFFLKNPCQKKLQNYFFVKIYQFLKKNLQ